MYYLIQIIIHMDVQYVIQNLNLSIICLIINSSFTIESLNIEYIKLINGIIFISNFDKDITYFVCNSFINI